ALAGIGVVVISGAQWSTNSTGVLFALGAAALWALYIVAGNRIAGSASDSRTGMTVGFVWAALLAAPVAWWLWPGMASIALEPAQLLGLAFGLRVLIAVIPYGLALIVLRMAGRAYFALLLALLPLTAAVMGAVALGQMLPPAEIAGIALVIAAVALRRPA